MNSYKTIFTDKKRILFVMAHPDDADVFFGGTITLLRADKKEVYVLVMTNGCRGSRENNITEEKLAAKRILEQKRALAVYGVQGNHFSTLNYKDGEAENSMLLIGKIAKVIRQFKPDIVCTHNPNSYFAKSFNGDHYHVNHKDHRVCGISAMDAVYPFSRDRNFFEEHTQEGLHPHVVRAMLFTGTPNETNTMIDLKKVIKKKKIGMAKHKSQFDGAKIEEILEHFRDNQKDVERGFYIKLR